MAHSFSIRHFAIRLLVLAAAAVVLGLGTPVTNAPTRVEGAFPGSNGKIAFHTDRDGNSEIYSMDSDGSGQTNLSNDSAQDSDPAWSADAEKIAFYGLRDGDPEIFSMNADGTGQTQCTTNGAGDYSPTWSPDGSKIAFHSNRDSNDEIYVITSDCTTETRCTNDSPSDSRPEWSPDGTKILFNHVDGDGEVYVIDASCPGTATNLTNNSEGDSGGSWSPDGSKIVFQSDRDPDNDTEIFIMDADGNNVKQCTFNTGHDTIPVWSPDGTRIAFTRGASGGAEIMAFDAANCTGSSEPSMDQLTTNSAYDDDANWQPDVPVFTHGIASGDVTDTAAILWTRVDRAADITAQVSTNLGCAGPYDFEGMVTTSAADDYTAKIDATALSAGTAYYYRWLHADSGVASDCGTFRTAPSASTAADVRFTYSGDSDGTTTNVAPAFPQTFAVLDRVREESADFFVYLGDTIYSDSGLRNNLPDPPGPGPAMTVDDYREAYKMNRDIQALPDLSKATSMYAIWDDHEVQNDYDGLTVSPTRYAAGRQAFLEYMPIRETGLLSDASCAGDPLYRKYRWGSEVEIFVLDERSCRSGDASAACLGDLAPAVPSPIRQQFPFNIFLAPNPPAGCLAAINDSNRTVLGPVQKAQFKSDLLNSSAKYKFVINEYPIQQFYVLLYDRWEGYQAERSELLDFIRDNTIDNVAFLTTDTHANLVTQVSIDRYTDPEPIATELVTGPIATNTFESEVFAFGGAFAVDAVNRALDVPWVDCRDGSEYSYGLVDVPDNLPPKEHATVTLKNDAGANVVNQVAPPDNCTVGLHGAPSIRVVDPDVTNDGIMLSADISAVVACYGGGNVNCDLNADGIVLSADITLEVEWYGRTWPPLDTAEGGRQPLRLYVRGSDPNGDPLTYSAPSLPAGATFDPSTRGFSWTPSSSQGGAYYRVVFKVSDGTLTDTDGVPFDVDDTIP